MKKSKLYPVIFAFFTAIITFIAGFAISFRAFHLDTKLAISVGMGLGMLFYILSYFNIRASFEIKRIVRDYHLTAKDLSKLTGLRESDFPIYNDSLNLIIPKRHWPQILDRLHEFEKAQEKNK